MSSTVYPRSVGSQARARPTDRLHPMTKTIPFDYVFQFTLKGERDNGCRMWWRSAWKASSSPCRWVTALCWMSKSGLARFQPVIDQRTIRNPRYSCLSFLQRIRQTRIPLILSSWLVLLTPKSPYYCYLV